MQGTIDASGGKRGELITVPTVQFEIECAGGDGGGGIIHMETLATPKQPVNKTRLGRTLPVPADNSDVQLLTDLSDRVALRSRWYATRERREAFPPLGERRADQEPHS